MTRLRPGVHSCREIPSRPATRHFRNAHIVGLPRPQDEQRGTQPPHSSRHQQQERQAALSRPDQGRELGDLPALREEVVPAQRRHKQRSQSGGAFSVLMQPQSTVSCGNKGHRYRGQMQENGAQGVPLGGCGLRIHEAEATVESRSFKGEHDAHRRY